MSLIFRSASRLPRSTIPPASRLLSTTPTVRKSATEEAKEKLDAANKKAGEAGVAGIEKGQTMTEKLKSAVGLGADKTKETASDMTGEAQSKAGAAKAKTMEGAEEAKAKTREGAEEAKAKTREGAEEAKAKTREGAEEVKRKAS